MPSVWWQDNAVQLIDQRQLPERLETAVLHTVSDVAMSIREMYVRGAPAIGATAAFGMALAARLSTARESADLLNDLTTAKAELDAARPTAVNLAWATGRVLGGRCERRHRRTRTPCVIWPWPRLRPWPPPMWKSTSAWEPTGRH